MKKEKTKNAFIAMLLMESKHTMYKDKGRSWMTAIAEGKPFAEC